MEEETYYSDGTNWVTNQRLIFGAAQYPLGNAINTTLKAYYPQKVRLARAAVTATLVITAGLAIFLESISADPLIASIIDVANIIGFAGILAISIYSIRTDYRKQPSFRRLMLQIASCTLFVALVLLWYVLPFFPQTKNSSLIPFWIFAFFAGRAYLRVLGRRGTFRLQLIERTRTVDVFSSADRQQVENLIGYIRLALVKRPRATQTGVKSPA